MTVAFLTVSVSRKGAGLTEAVRSLAIEAAQHPGLSIRTFALNDEYTETDLNAWNEISVNVTATLWPQSLGYAPDLLRSVLDARPDILHVHGLWRYTSVTCIRWAKVTGRPYVVSPHGMLDPWALRNSHWKKKLAGWLYETAHLRGAACLHALCEAEAIAIRAYGLRNPIAVVPNGVDLPEHATCCPPSWDGYIPKGAKVLLYLGRIHPKKGLTNLLLGWRSARKARESDDWHLVIAGWDQAGYERELRRVARELAIEDSVLFAGPQFGQRKDAALELATAFVLPSLSEGLPLTILEAWARGLPVLMTRQCNLPEGVGSGAALESEPNPDSLAHVLRTLFNMSESGRQAMGERGRALVTRKYSWPKVAAQMNAVYEWILGGPRPEGVVILE